MSATVRSASRPVPSPLTEPPRSLTMTCAPCFASSSAWPRPMPCPAPVTIATLPSRMPIRKYLSCRSCLGIAVAELVLHDLAGGVARERIDELELLGQLLLHQVVLEEIRAQVRQCGHIRGVLGHDDCARALAGAGVGQADHGHIGDLRVREEDVLELLRRDVLHVADDDVLHPAGDPHVALRVERAEVAA